MARTAVSNSSRNRLARLLPVLAVVTTGAALSAQIPRLPALPGVLNPTALIDRILRRAPALDMDSSQATGLFEFIPDNFDPGPFGSLTWLPRAQDGSFQLQPGAWEFEAESYCLQPGVRRPNQGHGYMTAPITGPRGNIVRHILQHAGTHPEISQEDIQTLLWAILARTDPRVLSRELQQVAAALLTPREVAELGTDTLGVVALDVLQSALPNLPPLVQQALEAENNLRDQLAKGASYARLEEIAVPDSSVEDDDPQTVGVGRWLVGKGYFARYFPSGYRKVRVEVYVPGAGIFDVPKASDDDSLGAPKKVGGLLNALGFLIRPAVYRPAGNASPALAASIMMAAAGGGSSYDPTGGAAVPADAGEQWLGISSRPAPDWDPGPAPPTPNRRPRPPKTPPAPPEPECKELTPGQMHDLANQIDGEAATLETTGRDAVADACPAQSFDDVYPGVTEAAKERIANDRQAGDARHAADAACVETWVAALTFNLQLSCARAMEAQRQWDDQASRMRAAKDLLATKPDAASCAAQQAARAPLWGQAPRLEMSQSPPQFPPAQYQFKTNDDWPPEFRAKTVPMCGAPPN